VVAEREVQERPSARGQLHRRGEPALDDREIADGQMPVELVGVGPHFQAVMSGQAARVDPRATVPHPRKPGDVLDHLDVVVGSQERLALTAVGQWQPADEVGEPGEGGGLLLGVVMQVIVPV
jgi:hypothetical protein